VADSEHARSCPPRSGAARLLAVGLAAGSVAALFVEGASGIVDTFTWSAPLWFSAGAAALAALLLGLVFDRRGASIPLALLAVLVMIFGAAFLMYGGLSS
jgi:hypothetical protein